MILLTKKGILNELYESFDKNNLKSEYAGPTKNTSFYEYMDSKELLNVLKNNCISFSKARKEQEHLFKKLNKVTIGNENTEQKKVINNVDKFYHSREEDLNFFKDYTKIFFDARFKIKQNDTEQGGTGLQILTPKQMLQRLPKLLRR